MIAAGPWVMKIPSALSMTLVPVALSNALPELVKDGDRGGKFRLRDIPNAEPVLSPLEIWCNEAQERYVLAVAPDKLALFESFCSRERCPFAVVGEATEAHHLTLEDSHFNNKPIDLPMSVLFGKPPRMHRDVSSVDQLTPLLNWHRSILMKLLSVFFNYPQLPARAS